MDVEQVLQPNTMSEEVTTYKRYLTYLDYFATGEGRTIELYMVIAANEADAKKKHLDGSYPANLVAQTYFGEYISLVEFESDNGKEIFFSFFKEAAFLYESLKLGGVDLHFKLHYNLS